MEQMERTRPALGRRLVAVAILAAVAWVLLKVVIGIVTAVAWTVVVVVAVVAALWALKTLL